MLVRPTPNWPNPKDIALGRGGTANKHAGNKNFRKKVSLRKNSYSKADPVTKKIIIRQLMAELQDEGFRFVEFNKVVNDWMVVNAKKSQRKLAQTLREKESCASLVDNAGTAAVVMEANEVIEADVVQLYGHGSAEAVEDELDLSFEMVPLPVDYQAIGNDETTPDEAVLEEEYVPVLLDAFGLLKV